MWPAMVSAPAAMATVSRALIRPATVISPVAEIGTSFSITMVMRAASGVPSAPKKFCMYSGVGVIMCSEPTLMEPLWPTNMPCGFRK